MALDVGAAAAPAAGSARHAVFHELAVAEVERLTDDAVAVTFDVPPELGEAYRFVQGQHVTIRSRLAADGDGDGAEVRRNYSICAPATSGRLRIAVKRLEGGAFSSYVVDRLAPGDRLEVMTPTGRFFTPLDPAQAKHYCALAAGSGITPVLSIVATALEVERQSRVTLVYANRTSRTVMFLEELEDLKNRYPDRLHLVHVLSREPQEVELFSGRLDAARLRRMLDTVIPVDDVDEWFLCGPFAMVTELRETLLAAGADRRHVHAELFHVESAPPARRTTDKAEAGPGAAVSILLDGRRSDLTLPADGVPVLEAALAVRADAPFACRGGVCGTCRAKVVEGEVEMDQNYALEPEEVERGYVLTCQAHPRSQRVVLDYDA
ncbi:MAG: phenylacetate-CoA oxygenase/reductase subunit PaaK [Actinomycetota bacterium]|nr:phenylacetate-CoA oxygenase/reductase subunit PaaK [Actinomycetota bacterium]